MRTILIAILTALHVIASPQVSDAQTPDPNKFFQDRYIEGTLDKAEKSSQTRSVKELLPKRAPTLPQGSLTSATEFGEPSFQDTEEPASDWMDTKGVPIDSIALIINAEDQEETFALLRTFSDILIEHDIQPEAVYTLQIPQFKPQDAPFDWARIIVRGGKIAFNRSIISEYGIEVVPAWLIRTPNGDTVLEGYSDIRRYITSKGELKYQAVMNDKNFLKVDREQIQEKEGDDAKTPASDESH
ncbi:MAG: hypothetical protein KDD60_04535 [Bdellovibrionales bacterium]|nr:hypothetical protein [Bdellovibrionales bacterium]